MPLEIVFLGPQNWRPLKPPLLKPYYRLHGKLIPGNFFRSAKILVPTVMKFVC